MKTATALPVSSRSVLAKERGRAFTLLELLVVLGLIAGMAVTLVIGLDGGKAAAVSAAQVLLTQILHTARLHAQTGEGARVLVNIDPLADARRGEPRFLRMLMLQIKQEGSWASAPVMVVLLPAGAYLLPGNFPTIPAGLFPPESVGEWTRMTGTPLRSTALRANQMEVMALASPVTEQWVAITFAGTGNTAQAGDLVIASGIRRSVGTFAEGESPVQLENPEAVRGVALSTYGLPVPINERESF